MRSRLLWETALGFVGFFTFLALIQALVNVFSPAPAIWPGLLFGVLTLATYLIWRAKP